MRSNYRLPWRSYLRLAAQVAILKTAWYSMRFRRPVIVGRRSRLDVPRRARLILGDGGILVLGLSPLGSCGASVELRPRSTLEITGRVQLLRGARIAVNWGGHVSVSAGTYLNEGALIDCDTRIIIGAGCAIGRDTAIMDTDVHRIVREGAVKSAPVTLGSRCWLGHRAIVLKGVSLGDGCVVAAGALVTRSHEAHRLLAGVPAADRGAVTWTLT